MEGVFHRLLHRSLSKFIRAIPRSKWWTAKIACPSCNKTMEATYIPVDPESNSSNKVEIDYCYKCALFWFDKDELEIAKSKQKEIIPGLNEYGDEAEIRSDNTAYGLLDSIASLPELERTPYTSQKDLKKNIAHLGFWVLFNVLVSTIAIRNDELFYGLAFVPAEPFRNLGLNFFTYSLVHGNFWHLVWNMFFFVFYGRDVACLLERSHFAELVLFGATAGAFMHLILSQGNSVPMIGFSGVVTAFAVYFALNFPYATVTKTRLVGGDFGGPAQVFRIRLPAYLTILIMIAGDLAGAIEGFFGKETGIAFGAHLGGAIAGFFFYVFHDGMKSKQQRQD